MHWSLVWLSAVSGKCAQALTDWVAANASALQQDAFKEIKPHKNPTFHWHVGPIRRIDRWEWQMSCAPCFFPQRISWGFVAHLMASWPQLLPNRSNKHKWLHHLGAITLNRQETHLQDPRKMILILSKSHQWMIPGLLLPFSWKKNRGTGSLLSPMFLDILISNESSGPTSVLDTFHIHHSHSKEDQPLHHLSMKKRAQDYTLIFGESHFHNMK